MEIFIAKLTFHIDQKEALLHTYLNNHQFDVQYRILFAGDEADANNQIAKIVKDEEEEIQGESGRQIRWNYKGHELISLQNVSSGFQFDSQTIEVSDIETYLEFLNEKSQRTKVELDAK